jgi:hypothetical protein
MNNHILDYVVNLNNAKLLKEKGCLVPAKCCYIGPEMFCTNLSDNSGIADQYTAITLQVAVEWIRVNFGIWLSVKTDEYGQEWYPTFEIVSEQLWEDLDKRHLVLTAYRKISPIYFPTQQEAYQAAIQHTLLKLI